VVGRVRVAYATACLLVVGAGLTAIVAGTQGCYTTFEPDCGFVCGAQGECPSDYACATDNICHKTSAPADLVCFYDAAAGEPLPVDAMVDAEKADARPIDAKEIDARPIDARPIDAEPIDAKPIDAEPIDAKPDAPIDARPIDAKPDAPLDAPPDAPRDAAVDAIDAM
jgi:hypothetical protein